MLYVVFSSCVFAEEFNQFRLDLLLANRGDIEAQFSVAGAYEEGKGIAKDLVKAFEWYYAAAKSNHNDAQFKLGEFYDKGLGVKANKEKAKFWYKKARQNGSRLASAYNRKPIVGKQVLKTVELKKIETKEKYEQKRNTASKKQKKAKAPRLAVGIKQKLNVQQTKLQILTQKKIVKDKDRAAAMAKHMQVLLNNKWSGRTVTSELLPSSHNNCLQSSKAELVCFSHEQQAVFGKSKIVFTTKSIFKDFRYNGDFTIDYYFQVLSVSDNSAPGKTYDTLGLRVEKGWQEPPQSMKCNISNTKELKCTRNGRHYYFRPRNG